MTLINPIVAPLFMASKQPSHKRSRGFLPASRQRQLLYEKERECSLSKPKQREKGMAQVTRTETTEAGGGRAGVKESVLTVCKSVLCALIEIVVVALLVTEIQPCERA